MLKQLRFWRSKKHTDDSNLPSSPVKQFLSLFLPLTALFGTGLVIFYQIQSNLTHNEIAGTERREVEAKADLFANRFSSIRADLMVLAAQHELQIILNPASPQDKIQAFRTVLAEEYLVLSQQKQQYDQIRFLNTHGQEVVRVNFNQGQPSIVADERLQTQSERYWFNDTIALQGSEVFISPLDLNVDFGKIEQPLKPVIRFGTPVVSDQGQQLGIVVLNYLAETFLKNLSSENSQSSGNILLLNGDGYWLKGPIPEDEWGFMYDERRDRSFANAFPETWQQIQTQNKGQFRTPSGLYTFTTIYPFLDIKGAQSSTGSNGSLEASATQVDTESYYWKLVTHVPTEVLTERSQVIRHQLLLLFVGLMGVTAMGTWLLVQARLKRQQSEQTAKGLEQTLQDVYRDQAQLVQTEKMASLGQLVAGVAHEINNPVNYIHGNLKHTGEYTQSLLRLIELYQTHYPQPVEEIKIEADEVDLEFIQEDLPKLLASMKIGAERIRQIVLSLRNFSRMDESECKTVDVHEGIESTLLILQHRLKSKPERPAPIIVRDYGDLPLVECYPGQLNQVFMNILVNAIDALEEVTAKCTEQEIQENPSQITIRTSIAGSNVGSDVDSKWIEVAIVDNGPGMSQSIQDKIFNPFFTTKSVGKGTGMGMSISYQIVTEKHRGRLKCFSTPGEGTEFAIQLPVEQQIKGQST